MTVRSLPFLRTSPLTVMLPSPVIRTRGPSRWTQILFPPIVQLNESTVMLARSPFRTTESGTKITFFRASSLRTRLITTIPDTPSVIAAGVAIILGSLFSTSPLLFVRVFVRAYTVRATFIAHGVPSTDKRENLQWAIKLYSSYVLSYSSCFRQSVGLYRNVATGNLY